MILNNIKWEFFKIKVIYVCKLYFFYNGIMFGEKLYLFRNKLDCYGIVGMIGFFCFKIGEILILCCILSLYVIFVDEIVFFKDVEVLFGICIWFLVVLNYEVNV